MVQDMRDNDISNKGVAAEPEQPVTTPRNEAPLDQVTPPEQANPGEEFDDLEDIEFLLDEIEDQIAPLA